MTNTIKEKGQYFTPPWAAEHLFDAHFSDIRPSAVIWEPTCGQGDMLAAIPDHIKCIGTELDPQLVELAKTRSGKQVINADCLDVDLKAHGITHVFGNLPFKFELFESFMDKCSAHFQLGDFIGLIIPAYFLQTSRTVRKLNKNWTIKVDMIPRDLFPNLEKPLIFAIFIRDNDPQLLGLLLYNEVAGIKDLPLSSQQILHTSLNGSRSVWREAVNAVLNELGGIADLKAIYKAIEGKRPTGTTWWKEQVRKVLQNSFNRVSEGVYCLAHINDANY